MKPEDKAKELIEKFSSLDITTYGCSQDDFGTNPCIISNKLLNKSAKDCAIICIDEQINFIKHWGNVDDYVNYLLAIKKELKITKRN